MLNKYYSEMASIMVTVYMSVCVCVCVYNIPVYVCYCLVSLQELWNIGRTILLTSRDKCTSNFPSSEYD